MLGAEADVTGTKLDEELDEGTRALLERYGFERATFEQLRARLAGGLADEEHNRVTSPLAPPEAGDVIELPPLGSSDRARLHALGLELVARGAVGVVVLAGGMATRFGGVVKAAVEVTRGLSFLDLKLRDVAHVAATAGGTIPVYLMTSFATHDEVTKLARAYEHAGVEVVAFPQFISLRLTASGALFRDGAGKLSPYAPGHGDLVPALRRAGILAALRARGVELLFMSNVDNLAATLDPAVIGAHAEERAELTFEVARLDPGDKGGVPARLDGRLQVIEAMRYPRGFEERSIPLFSTNSFVLDVAAVDREFDLSWFRVTKQVEGRPAIQFERLVNQLTAFVRARGLAISRDGTDSRFLPVKDPPDLAARRASIEAVLSSRGAL